jgi:hypothetical protein
MRIEDRLQQACAFDRDFADQLPADLVLGSRGHLIDQTPNTILPRAHLFFQDSDHDDGIAGGSDRSVFDRIRKLLNGRGVVPQTGLRRLRHFMQGTFIALCEGRFDRGLLGQSNLIAVVGFCHGCAFFQPVYTVGILNDGELADFSTLFELPGYQRCITLL